MAFKNLPPPTLEALLGCGVDDILTDIVSHDSIAISQALKERAEREDTSAPQAEALSYLAMLMDIGFCPEEPNGPYRPMMSMADGRRTPLPVDLERAELAVLKEYASKVKHPALRARLNDYSWLGSKDARAARLAAEGFSAFPIDAVTWDHSARHAWRRGIQLCQELGKGGAKDLAKQMATLREAAHASDPSSLRLLRDLGELLVAIDRDKAHLAKLADRLDTHGKAGAKIEPHWARECVLLASRIYQKLEEHAKAADVRWIAAQTYLHEVEERNTCGGQAHLTTGHLYLAAIETLREIPHSQRERLGVTQEIQRLRHLHRQANEVSTEFMGEYKGEPIDISDMVRNARSAVDLDDTWKAL